LFLPCLWVVILTSLYGGAFVVIPLYALMMTFYLYNHCKNSINKVEDSSFPNFWLHFRKVDFRFFIKFFVLFILPIGPMASSYILKSPEVVEQIKLLLANNAEFIDFSKRHFPINAQRLPVLEGLSSDESSRLIIYWFSFSFWVSTIFLALSVLPITKRLRQSWSAREGRLYNRKKKELVSILGIVVFWPTLFWIWPAYSKVFKFGMTHVSTVTTEDVYNTLFFLLIAPWAIILASSIQMGALLLRHEDNKPKEKEGA